MIERSCRAWSERKSGTANSLQEDPAVFRSYLRFCFKYAVERREQFAEISNYAVAMRCPDDWFEPSRDDGRKALKTAEVVIALVKAQIGTADRLNE